MELLLSTWEESEAELELLQGTSRKKVATGTLDFSSCKDNSSPPLFPRHVEVPRGPKDVMNVK